MIDPLEFHVRRRCALLLAASVTCACGAPDAGEPTGYLTQALDVCGETVPANRAVDGIPAYAQCDATMDSSIWSNNGVDTSLTSLGSDWVQTQRGGGYQCTELAYRYMRFRWNVSYRSGDAQEWCDGELPANLVKTTVPVHGDLIVFQGGVCGAAESTGHIAVVDTVDAERETVTIVEENRAGRRSAQQSCATCFLHATANDGSVGGAGGMGGMPTGTGGVVTGGRGAAAGGGGLGGGGTGTAGSGPATAGTAGDSMAGSGTAGSAGLGGGGGSSSTTGGGSTLGGAGNSSGAAGASPTAGMGSAGRPGSAGESGTSGEPFVGESTLEAGCSVSATRSPERQAPSLGVALFLLAGVLARRRTTRPAV
jgi:MYXO-CTERM domain-containing protein